MKSTPLYLIIFAGLALAGIVGLSVIPGNVTKTTLQTQTTDGVTIFYNLYQPLEVTQGPVVVIGHGVNVNKEMMTTFAVELAARGFIVASLDWRGHGRSTGFLEREGLYLDLEAVIADIPSHAVVDMEKIALIGYSMGGFPTYTYAVDHAAVKAWVGVGTVADGSISDTATPQNVLMIIAKYDEAFSLEDARESMVYLTGEPLDSIEFEKVYGSISGGTARKIHVVPGADHLTTPWNSDFVHSATSWITETFEGHPVDSTVTFHKRVIFLLAGLIGLVGLVCTLSSVLADKLKVEKLSGAHLVCSIETLSAKAFIGKYYVVTLLLIPTVLLFVPLFLTPLLFTAMLTTVTGGLGVNLLVYCWLLARKEKKSIKTIVKSNVCQSWKIWLFSAIVTVVFMVCYYFLVGLHFLGTIPSQPRIPYLVLYTGILFIVFLFYALFIQKASVPFLERKLKMKSGIKILFMGIVNFILIYSWFVIVILVPCIIMDNYFFAMILILMIPIFLFLIFFGVYMEKVTGSVIPKAVLQAVWIGFITTTLTPFASGLAFFG